MACCERARQRGVLPGMPLAEVAALSKLDAAFGRNQAGGRGSCGRARLLREGEAPAEPYHPTPTLHSARQEPRPPQESKRLTAIQLPAIQLHGHQAEHDHAALAELAVWCEQFSPLVGLEESDSPACLLLDVTGLGPLFGTEYHLAELIVCAFGRRGYQVRVGVADTVSAAWALACYGTSNGGQASSRNPQRKRGEINPQRKQRNPKRKRGEIQLATRPRSRFLKLHSLVVPKGRKHVAWGVSPRKTRTKQNSAPEGRQRAERDPICCRPSGARTRIIPNPWGSRPRLYAFATPWLT